MTGHAPHGYRYDERSGWVHDYDVPDHFLDPNCPDCQTVSLRFLDNQTLSKVCGLTISTDEEINAWVETLGTIVSFLRLLPALDVQCETLSRIRRGVIEATDDERAFARAYLTITIQAA